MFPAYFSMVGVCCSMSVASFGYLHPWKTASTTQKYQLGFLLAAFAFNMSNLLVFTPMTIESLKSFLGEEKLKEIINFTLHYIADLDILIKRGTFIEFRSRMLNVSPIGRNCSQE